MDEQNKNGSEKSESAVSSDYVAPTIEAVVTPEKLEREVQYAGGVSLTFDR